jgi:hypothetical protein
MGASRPLVTYRRMTDRKALAPQEARPEAAPRSPPGGRRASGSSVPKDSTPVAVHISKKEARQSRVEKPGFRVFGGR